MSLCIIADEEKNLTLSPIMTKDLSKTLPFGPSFDNRFMEHYLGAKMWSDPTTAVVELIANAWDAGATKVKIIWPKDEDKPFSISDNGHGISSQDFIKIWTRLSYNRANEQGPRVHIPEDNNANPRIPYGKNGKGRFSTFIFHSSYNVASKKDGRACHFSVNLSKEKEPIIIHELDLTKKNTIIHNTHGTTIYTNKSQKVVIREDDIRSEIGLRFLTDPNFIVLLNNKQIKFQDIKGNKVSKLTFKYQGKDVNITAIDIASTSKTNNQQGVAWHANKRLVGKCSWEGFRNDSILHPSIPAAMKSTFIVDATLIRNFITADWSEFRKEKEVLEFYDLAKIRINCYLQKINSKDIEDKTKSLLDKNKGNLADTDFTGLKRWKKFIEAVQEKCPNLTYHDLEMLAEILATLEASTSKYALIRKLKTVSPQNVDDFNKLIDDWDLQSALIVLNDIRWRLTLIESIREKVNNPDSLEVQDLQPLFKKGLWILSPEFDSSEFTSNQGMTAVIQKICKKSIKASRNRPDFVILPKGSGSVGSYGCYEYDDDGNEIGIKKVIIVELKKPGISLGNEEKQQCWKYVKELYSTGAILPHAKVDCFLLGSIIEDGENSPTIHRESTVKVIPLLFNTILRRADTRLLNLREKVEKTKSLNRDEIRDYDRISNFNNSKQVPLI